MDVPPKLPLYLLPTITTTKKSIFNFCLGINYHLQIQTDHYGWSRHSPPTPPASKLFKREPPLAAPGKKNVSASSWRAQILNSCQKSLQEVDAVMSWAASTKEEASGVVVAVDAMMFCDGWTVEVKLLFVDGDILLDPCHIVILSLLDANSWIGRRFLRRSGWLLAPCQCQVTRSAWHEGSCQRRDRRWDDAPILFSGSRCLRAFASQIQSWLRITCRLPTIVCLRLIYVSYSKHKGTWPADDRRAGQQIGKDEIHHPWCVKGVWDWLTMVSGLPCACTATKATTIE
jgi:hypothetical protein